MKRLWFLLIPLAAVVAWLSLRGSAPVETAFTKVTRETLISTLSTNGKLEPIEYASIRSESAGSIERIHVERGHDVTKGQLLVTLDAAAARSDLARAEAQISSARADLETLTQGGRAPERAEIESGLARARAELATAKRELESAQRLQSKNAGTQAEVVAARDAVQKAELQITSLDRRRESLVTAPDRTAGEARVREAQTAAQAALQRISLSQIRSPMSGNLYRLEVRSGAYLQPGDLVAEVGILDRLHVRVYVDEPELGRVEKGLPLTITWDALPGKQWKGIVETVPTQVVTLGTRQVGEVICTIENPGNALIPGTNINAEIRSREVANAITIPKEVLRREGNVVGVYKLQGERLLWQPVKTGVASVTRVQVLSGLTEGEAVALPVDRVMKNGEAVKPVFP